MEIGHQVLAWRRTRGMTQTALAERAGVKRLFISRLESGRVDPSLSSVRRLAIALGLSPGDLIDRAPAAVALDRNALDAWARAAVWPGSSAARKIPAARVLSKLIRARREALGLRRSRGPGFKPSFASLPASHAARWLRASIGEAQWAALQRRIDKFLSLEAAGQRTSQ
jgi:transcriptional regulator with XRE-family HTH domain